MRLSVAFIAGRDTALPCQCFWLVAALLLAGCATPGREASFTLQPGGDHGAHAALVWPEAPEQPRYAYVGQLIGEQNFAMAEPERRHGVERALRWLVGLGAGGRDAATMLRRPSAVVVAPDGRVLVSDIGRPSVFVFDPAGSSLQVWDLAGAGQPMRVPSGLAALDDGAILLADAELGAVFRLGPDGRPQGSFGQGILQRPGGLTWDPGRGELYVADVRAHDIKVFDGAGRLLRVLGGPGEEAGRFNAPSQLAFAGGLLYVSDTFNARIQVLSPDGAPQGLISGRGLYVGNLVRPKGVAVDLAGRVYIVESYYGHLLVFDTAGNFLLPLTTAGSPLEALYLPAGVAVDEHDQVYLADMYNGRVLVWRYVGID